MNSCTGVCPCGESCPVADAISMIGGKWKLRLVCSLYVDGTQRYNDLLKKTKGITNAMLSTSLKELESDGIVTRRQYEQIPPRVEYALTDRGAELWPILHRLAHWAKDEPFDGDAEVLPGRNFDPGAEMEEAGIPENGKQKTGNKEKPGNKEKTA